MRLRIRLFKLALVLTICFVGFATHEVFAKQQLASQFAITNAQRSAFAQNNILFYDPDDCVKTSSGYISGICGSTAKEKYWSALRNRFNAEVAAGIMGNIVNEGGFNPVSVESCNKTPYDFADNKWINGWTADRYWTSNTSENGTTTGVGSFGITGTRSQYFEYIEEKDSSLKQYFVNPGQYSFGGCSHLEMGGAETGGDALMAVIGEEEFDELVELEVNYTFDHNLDQSCRCTERDSGGNCVKTICFDLDYFKGLNSVSEASYYFAYMYEQCNGCDADKNTTEQIERREASEAQYELFKDYSCGAKAASNGNIVNLRDSITDATIIGDSISMQSREELMSKFPAGFVNAVGGRSSTWGGICEGDVGGKAVIETIIAGGTVSNQVALPTGSAECGTVDVGIANLNKNVVWALGANADESEVLVTEQTVNDVLGLIGNRNLFLVLPYNGQRSGVSDDIGQIYQSIANNHDNVFVIDWAGEVKKDPEKYISTDDGMAVHPTDDGKRLYAELIYQKVNNQEVSDGDDCGTVVERAGQKIADIAKKLSCSEANASDCERKKADVYEETRKKWGFGGGIEAVKFVETVILESGQDESFAMVKPGDAAFEEGGNQNYRNLKNLNEYFQNNKDLYLELSDDSGLMPGDIIISAGGSGEGNDAMIYIGDGKVARAERSGRVSYWPTIKPYKSQSYYRKYRNKKEETKATGSCSMCNDGGGGGGGQLRDGGFTSIEEADREVMSFYRALTESEAKGYGFLLGEKCYLCNCTGVSTWFLVEYLGVGTGGYGNGGGYADRFLNENKDKLDIRESDTPVAYSIAGCRTAGKGNTAGHTFVVLGVDESRNKMLVGEAGWDAGFDFIGVHERDAIGSDEYYNDPNTCTYIDVSNALKRRVK